jgi:hypothetical protein
MYCPAQIDGTPYYGPMLESLFDKYPRHVVLSDLVLPDFSKAFDAVEALTGGHLQCVCAGGVLSGYLPFLSGVPQGSILGEAIRTYNYHMYAGDVQLCI